MNFRPREIVRVIHGSLGSQVARYRRLSSTHSDNLLRACRDEADRNFTKRQIIVKEIA